MSSLPDSSLPPTTLSSFPTLVPSTPYLPSLARRLSQCNGCFGPLSPCSHRQLAPVKIHCWMEGWDSGIQTPCSCPYPWLILHWATAKGRIGFVRRWKEKKGGGLHLGLVRVLPRWAQSSSFTWDLEHMWNRLSNLQCVSPLYSGFFLQVSSHLHISSHIRTCTGNPELLLTLPQWAVCVNTSVFICWNLHKCDFTLPVPLYKLSVVSDRAHVWIE